MTETNRKPVVLVFSAGFFGSRAGLLRNFDPEQQNLSKERIDESLWQKFFGGKGRRWLNLGRYFDYPQINERNHCTSTFSNKIFRHLFEILARQTTYRGSPTYTKITNTVSTNTVFGLCTCKWGIFALVGDPLQSH